MRLQWNFIAICNVDVFRDAGDIMMMNESIRDRAGDFFCSFRVKLKNISLH